MTGSRPVRRVPWRDAVASAAFPAEMRVVRGTLLCLARLMTPDGTLDKSRAQMTDAAGLPPRTLDRHLARAVSAGWLEHVQSGGHNHNGKYGAALPEPDLCAPLLARNLDLCAPLARMQRHDLCAPPGGELINSRASDSEHVAVNNNRDRRDDHHGSRGPQTIRTDRQIPVTLLSARPSVPVPTTQRRHLQGDGRWSRPKRNYRAEGPRGRLNDRGFVLTSWRCEPHEVLASVWPGAGL